VFQLSTGYIYLVRANTELREDWTHLMASFQEIEHTADWAFQVRGRDFSELLKNAALGIAELEKWPGISGREVTRHVQVVGNDRESLLVNWLNELLYLHEKHGEAYFVIEFIEATDTHLRARIRGHKSAAPNRKIKAVTFHNIQIERNGGWNATIVVDV